MALTAEAELQDRCTLTTEEGLMAQEKKKDRRKSTDINHDEDNVIPKPITIGTGCSGMDLPILAMLKLKISMIHKFSADNCPKALKTISANFEPETKYESMQAALDGEKEAQLDVFVAGIPCQPFS